MVTVGNGVGELNVNIQIGAAWTKDFYFYNFDDATQVTTEESLTGATFEFFLKRNIGDRVKTYSLTLGSGISLITYSSNGIRIVSTLAQNSIEEGEYYCELRRTDLDKAKLSGKAILSFDAK